MKKVKAFDWVATEKEMATDLFEYRNAWPSSRGQEAKE